MTSLHTRVLEPGSPPTAVRSASAGAPLVPMHSPSFDHISPMASRRAVVVPGVTCDRNALCPGYRRTTRVHTPSRRATHPCTGDTSMSPRESAAGIARPLSHERTGHRP
jgi:hypothetical protein